MPGEQHAQSQDKAADKERTRKAEERNLETAGPESVPAEVIQKARLEPNRLTSRELRQLQGRIGNQATGSVASRIQLATERVIQRNGTDPLTRAQVNTAISFYQNRSTQYTEAIIRQLQGEVGAPVTGVPDAELAQGVARYQQVASPGSVDGMAGPRTLPALFPSGLAEQAEVETYTGEARTVIEGVDWPMLTVEERADAILAKVNDRLTAAGVPVVGKVVQALGANEYGRFAFSLWSIRVNQDLLANATLTTAQAADLADTMYHEARHAEQWYRMAQLLSGQGKTSAEIASTMGIPARIATIAFGDPIDEDSMEALIADGWFQSVYGTGSARRARALGPRGTYQEYRNLPEETDAWRVGSSVTAEYTAAAAAPAPATSAPAAPAAPASTGGGG
jgi:hypothetical protein